MGFNSEVYQTLKTLMSIPLKIFWKVEDGNTTKMILRDQHYPDTKAREENSKMKKDIFINIWDKYM